MTQEQNLERMARGQEASLVEATIVPFINERITRVIQRLVASYRGGDTDHDKFVGGIAEITAMYNLLADLESDQRRGVIAADKEMNRGP